MLLSKLFTPQSWRAIALTIPVLVYLHARAYELAFTYDESWSFLGYVREDIWVVLTNAHPAANNHIFHSLAMRVSYLLFGESEYALRIPVLMAFIGYAYFAFQATKELAQRHHWMAFVILVYQPYLLDYFSMARGYGLAIMAMMGMVYFLAVYARTGSRRGLAWALAWSMIAAYSNFTFLLVMLAGWCGIALIAWVKQRRAEAFTGLAISAVIAAVLFSYPVWQLIQAQELYYGGQDGFFSDTLMSLASHALYLRFDGVYLAALFVVIGFAGLGRLLLHTTRRSIDRIGYWGAWVLWWAALGSVAQHYLLGSPFLIDRTALFMLPLLLMTFLWLISTIELEAWRNRLTLMVAIGCVANAWANANVDYQLDFKSYADLDKAIRAIGEDADPEARFHLGKSVYMNAPIMYYKRRHEVEQLLPAGLEFCDDAGPTPYYYLFEKDTACVAGKDVELWKHFPVSNTYLYREGKQ